MPSTSVRNGIYWSDRTCTYHYEFRIAGRKRNGDTGHAKKSLALDYVAELKVRARRESDGLVVSVAAPTLEQALEKWAAAERGSVTEKHLNDRLSCLRRHLAPVLGLPLNKLDTGKLDDLRTAFLAGEWMGEGWKAESARARTPGGWNKIRRHIVALVNWCIDRELLQAMPFRGRPLKSQEKTPLIVWPEDVWKFLGIVDSVTRSQDIRTAIRLQVQLGLRENEALGARWDGFVERLGVYRPPDTKNRKVREIALPPGLMDYLRLHHGRGQHGLLLPTTEGKAHVAGYTKKALASAGKLLGIVGLHPHSLRATFATAHWEAGTPLSQITAMLGHSSPQTTMIYINQRPRDAVEAQGRVAQNMGLVPG